MKQQDNLLKARINGKSEKHSEYLRVIDNSVITKNVGYPLRNDAFKLDDQAKINAIASHFQKIIETLGLDLNDDSIQGTPQRVAKMFVSEIFSGLNPGNKPDITLFENKFLYNQMLVEKNIKVHSYCEHHFLPIIGKAHVAYISNGYVIGLSKLNRIVDYYARRPQIQERLTEQIASELMDVLKTEDVAVLIEAEHMCVAIRGIKDEECITTTSSFYGKFQDPGIRNEFLTYIYNKK